MLSIKQTKKLIVEGGNAVDGVSRINQENVAATLDDIYKKLLPLLGITKNHIAILGSTGKKLPGGSSGDIDLAVDKKFVMKVNKLKDDAELYKFLVNTAERVGYDFVWLKGLGIVSIGWPIKNIDGKQENQRVQLDIMPSDNIKMTSWGMSSPYEKDEPYKGAVRNELLYWIAELVDYKVFKQQANEITGEIEDLEFERNIFDTMHGLVSLKQSYLSPKTGKRMKNKMTISRKLIDDNPESIAKLFFGANAKPETLISTKQVWDAMMSPEFPYPKYRKQIIQKTIKGCKQKGLAYPPYFDEYLKNNTLNERTETTFDSPRSSMTKIHQMKAADFVEFLMELKSAGVTKSKKFNLAEFNVTEKADGQGVRIICYDGKIGVESSYSGVVFDASNINMESFRETLLYWQNSENATQLLNIARKNNTWFKITGELFYVNDDAVIDEDSGITFIATKYDSKKMGKVGAMVCFDVSAITPDGKIEKLDDKDKKKIIKDFKSLSNKDFKIYDDSNFAWKGEINLEIDYDTEAMRRIFEEPSILLTKDYKKHLKQLQMAIADAFSREIRKKGSVMGLSDSEVEGIVFQINGKKYGATNFGWSEKKKEYWSSHDAFFNRISELLKLLTGFVQKNKVYNMLSGQNAKINYEVPFRKELPKFLADMQQLKRNFDEDTTIPKALKKQQSKFIDNTYKKILKLQPTIESLRNFIKSN